MPMAKKTPAPAAPKRPAQLQTSHKRVGMRALAPKPASLEATRVQVARKGFR